MIRYFFDALRITNNNIILATPLILFMLIVSIYSVILQTMSSSPVMYFLFLMTLGLMIAAFAAGWFYIVKKAIENDRISATKDEKIKKSFDLMNLMVTGVGENFLSFLGALFLYVLILLTFLIFGSFIGVKLIGNLNFPIEQLKPALVSAEATQAFIQTLSAEDLLKLTKWKYLILIGGALFSFITLFWSVDIVKFNKNPFKALFNSNKFLWKNFFSTFLFYIMLFVFNFVVMLVTALLSMNNILYFISMLIYFYFMVYMVVLVFLYYDDNTEKQDYSNNGSNGNGQDGICN